MQLISPYKLGLDSTGALVELSDKGLDAKAYSRMKYGVRTDLKNFARILAEELRVSAPQLFNSPKPPAILTSYKAVAPPATTLARYCLDIINLARFEAGLSPGEMVRVYRPQDYIEEYATLPIEERKKLIGNQTSNTLQGRTLEGYIPVIIDDIHVTGTYTAMMQQVVGDYSDIVYVYLIVCDDSLKDSAHAESGLNGSQIRTPSDLLPYIEANDFVFTRRYLKMLLKTKLTELKAVIETIPDSLLEQVARGILDTDSELRLIFPDTCTLIFDACTERSIF